MATKILYVCEPCHDNAPECCGHHDPNDLRVMPDGAWVCRDCHDHDNLTPAWADLPPPPRHVPER